MKNKILSIVILSILFISVLNTQAQNIKAVNISKGELLAIGKIKNCS